MMHASCQRIGDDWRITYSYPGAALQMLQDSLHAAARMGPTMCRPGCGPVAAVTSGYGCLAADQMRAMLAWGKPFGRGAVTTPLIARGAARAAVLM